MLVITRYSDRQGKLGRLCPVICSDCLEFLAGFFRLSRNRSTALVLAGLSVSILLWILPARAVADPENWQRADYIVDSFLEIALKNEYTRQNQIVRKWPQSGVFYHYVHRVDDNRLHEEFTEMHLRQLQAITGLPFTRTDNARQANLIIVFSREDSLKDDLQQYFGMQSAKERDDFFRHSVCLGRFSTTDQGAIYQAAVIIPVDRARGHAKLLDCIVEELTQVIGLPNDSDKVFPSIFNDHSIDHLLSGLDFILLKILYDPRLKAGLNQAQARPVVKAIVAGFIANGLIEKADLLVRKGGLYEVFN